ncbi:MAG: carboxymuconolactone decarboxylase family protein [Phycisphaerales bacterium]|jgi:uncharacterized peroxidase-related enzyme|nr:carboxymuconolactone decarboxylase family protein [Phycisphaerales bacterium]
MTRLTPVEPAQATGRAKEIFDGPLAGKHFNIFKGMAASPALLDGYLAFSGALAKGKLSLKERETVQLAIGAANSCDYCQAAHTAIGKGGGLTDAQTVAARRGSGTGDPKLEALTKFALAMHEKRGNISDADVKAFRDAGYGDEAIGEVVANYALATLTNYFNHLNQTPVDFPTPQAL